MYLYTDSCVVFSDNITFLYKAILDIAIIKNNNESLKYLVILIKIKKTHYYDDKYYHTQFVIAVK